MKYLYTISKYFQNHYLKNDESSRYKKPNQNLFLLISGKKTAVYS